MMLVRRTLWNSWMLMREAFRRPFQRSIFAVDENGFWHPLDRNPLS